MSGIRNIARLSRNDKPITQTDRTPGFSRYDRLSSGSKTAEESKIERFTLPQRMTAEPASMPAARRNLSIAEPGVVVFASALPSTGSVPQPLEIHTFLLQLAIPRKPDDPVEQASPAVYQHHAGVPARFRSGDERQDDQCR